MQQNIAMKYAGYEAWILPCKYCEFEFQIYRIFPMGLLFFGASCTTFCTRKWHMRIIHCNCDSSEGRLLSYCSSYDDMIRQWEHNKPLILVGRVARSTTPLDSMYGSAADKHSVSSLWRTRVVVTVDWRLGFVPQALYSWWGWAFCPFSRTPSLLSAFSLVP